MRTPYNKKVYEKYVHPMKIKYESLENCKNISKEYLRTRKTIMVFAVILTSNEVNLLYCSFYLFDMQKVSKVSEI